jgi:hypothetical protein
MYFYGSLLFVAQDVLLMNVSALIKIWLIVASFKHWRMVSYLFLHSQVRWTDLNEKTEDKVKQLVVTMFVTCATIALVAFIVKLCRDKSAFFAAMAISISNALFPLFAKLLTSTESHASESGKQASLYVKIAVFRWVNTAIVITIITVSNIASPLFVCNRLCVCETSWLV